MNSDANEIRDIVSNVQNLTKSVKDIAETYQNPMIFFQELTSTVSHCIEVYKKEETKQQKIQSETKIIIKKFETQKAMFEEYLDKVFDERSNQFKEYFKRVDEAMKTDNIQQMALLLDNMNKLAQSAPFAVFSSLENTQKALEDKNYEWDF